MTKFICFLGSPGAGKTTIASALSEELYAHYLSGGDIAREAANYNPAVRDALDRGEMAPEQEMDKLIREKLSQCGGLVVIDGYPRYWEQLCDLFMLSTRQEISLIFTYVFCGEDTVLARLKARNRGDDDRTRLDNYHARTRPMISWMMSHGIATPVYNTFDSDIQIHVNMLAEMYR